MGGGTKPSTVPQREALFWAAGYKKSVVQMYEWMDGWPTVWMDAGWLGCPQSRHAREPGQVWGNVRHYSGTKPTTVPQGEVRSWATGHKKSASLDGKMDE